jgi:trans-aconitate 2-methyltransferase
VPAANPDWNAASYHRISNPHVEWGRRVLARLELAGDETVLDLGCGTGRLTRELARRLLRGRVHALDRSATMLAEARGNLEPNTRLVRADALALPFRRSADVLFSTATLHWILDQPSLYRSLHGVLRPGGRLHTQSGGKGNVAREHARFMAIAARPEFAPDFVGLTDPWVFLGPEEARPLLEAAGFTDIEAGLEQAEARLEDRDQYREFVETIVFSVFLARVTDAARRTRILDMLCDAAAGDDPPFTLGYVRLNLRAKAR